LTRDTLDRFENQRATPGSGIRESQTRSIRIDLRVTGGDDGSRGLDPLFFQILERVRSASDLPIQPVAASGTRVAEGRATRRVECSNTSADNRDIDVEISSMTREPLPAASRQSSHNGMS
jgi:hypothetical protein